ncbi:hypothetical protein V1478_003093 [Vespula squamosa]|uniref:Uncharacterized protein n=1 Tax=Vespula squamosa TaxID=30214 RepID=A0ABD2BT53_VESSQ
MYNNYSSRIRNIKTIHMIKLCSLRYLFRMTRTITYSKISKIHRRILSHKNSLCGNNLEVESPQKVHEGLAKYLRRTDERSERLDGKVPNWNVCSDLHRNLSGTFELSSVRQQRS